MDTHTNVRKRIIPEIKFVGVLFFTCGCPICTTLLALLALRDLRFRGDVKEFDLEPTNAGAVLVRLK